MRKLLLIDDEDDFCYFLKINLELLGEYKIFIETDGSMGIKSARKHKPDIILLDVMMPGMNGFEVLQKLKEDSITRSIPVIILTARDDRESKMKGAELSATDYIVKPFEVEGLKNKIDQMFLRLESGGHGHQL